MTRDRRALARRRQAHAVGHGRDKVREIADRLQVDPVHTVGKARRLGLDNLGGEARLANAAGAEQRQQAAVRVAE
jgi:hypothetical protein